MKVKDMIERLQAYNPEAELRLAIQPRYPHELAIAGLASAEEVRAYEEEAEDDKDDERVTEAPKAGSASVVYIATGDWIAYGPTAVWGAIVRR